jgi:hypothetical protein
MASGRFDNFDIDITCVDESKNEYEIRVTHSPDGETPDGIPVVFPLDERTFKKESFDVRQWMDKPEQIKEFGKRLYGLLFPGEAARRFDVSRRIQREKAEWLRVRVRSNQAEVMELPWEFCYEESARQFVARQPETPFVRYITGQHSKQDLCMTPPIKLLVAIAAPEDQASLDTEGEERRIREALEGLETRIVDWRVVRSATAGELHTAILEHEPNILHYSGHGTKGALLMEDASKRTHVLASEQIRPLLSRPFLKLIVLNACDTGAYAIGGELMGVAADLMREEIPAIVAMQFPVPEAAGLEFTRRFYACIALGLSLEQAVTEARIGILTVLQHPVYWGIPVLFTRAPDGTILPDIHVATEGLRALHEGIQVSHAARAAAASAAQEFRQVCETIDELYHYKRLHDQLHRLQFHCYDRIVPLIRRAASDLDYGEAEEYQIVLQDIIRKSKEVACKPFFTPLEISWIDDIVKAGDLLTEAIERSQREPLSDAVDRLNRVLTSSPSMINAGLIYRARELRLLDMVKAMERGSLEPALPQELVGRYKAGQEALRSLDRRLTGLCNEHNGWQIVDLELRRIENESHLREGGMGRGMAGLKRAWPDLTGKAEKLYGDRMEEWATELREAGHKLALALVGDNPDRVSRAFRLYRRRASFRFLDVDENLKALCGELRSIGYSLASLLEVLS